MDYIWFLQMISDAMDRDMLVLVALGIFLLIIVIGALIIYFAACSKNRNTEMPGLVKVGLSLNEWPDDGITMPGEGCTKLVFGEYLVSMHDPQEIQADRLDPRVSGLKKAYCRQYSVGALFRRFATNYLSAGMAADASGRLLHELLKDTVFCDDLGMIYRKNVKKGLRVNGINVWIQDKKYLDKVSVYTPVPEEIASSYAAATGCEAKMLCITLRYYPRDIKDGEE